MRLEQQNWILMKTPMPSFVALFSQGRRGGGQHRSYSSSYFADLSSDSPKEKAAPDEGHDLLTINTYVGLALTSFKPTLRLVDYIDAALTAHDAAIAVTLLERTEGVTNFHGFIPSLSRRGDCALGYIQGQSDPP